MKPAKAIQIAVLIIAIVYLSVIKPIIYVMEKGFLSVELTIQSTLVMILAVLILIRSYEQD